MPINAFAQRQFRKSYAAQPPNSDYGTAGTYHKSLHTYGRSSYPRTSHFCQQISATENLYSPSATEIIKEINQKIKK